MKIINLEIDNYKRVKAVHIEPDGSLVLLTGRNAQGKTSILDAIWAALLGSETSRTTKQPIREGESQASVRLDLGEYIVTRRWRKNDVGTLTVESPRGAQYGSPQKILDGLVGKLSMDPLAFIRQKPSDQVATLVGVLGDTLGFDPVKLEEQRLAVFEERRIANANVRGLTSLIESYPEYPEDTPTEPVSAGSIIDEYAAARENLAERDEAAADIKSLESEIADEKKRHAEELAGMEKDLKKALARAAAFGPNDVDPDEIKARLDSIDATNAIITGAALRRVAEEGLAVAIATAKEHDDKLIAIAEEKEKGLAAATFPLPGLSFDEDGVTYNGVPLAQASGSEKRTVGLALAMATNAELRVIRIDEGESLDAEGLEHIRSMAEEQGYQVWVSRVDESGTAGVIIEDGMVAS